jgi:integrase
MSRVEEYLQAAERKNTLLSYASAIRHFEEEWKGLLPASSDAIARYLANYASTLSGNTLRHRLAALSRWHIDQGFADPTKSPTIRQLLKGIRTVHNTPENRARPLELEVLERVDRWLTDNIARAQSEGDHASMLRFTRDRSLILLGFWRGFRSDELVRLNVENIQIVSSEGMTCYLDRSKGDRQTLGKTYKCPSLTRLCPVAAFTQWIALAKLDHGPVYRGIDRWGHLSNEAMHPNSLIPLLRNMLTLAGVPEVKEYSSHSLRRGFAGWARASGWDIKELMEYVGWQDIKSAMRYLETANSGLQARFEKGLSELRPVSPALNTVTTLTPNAGAEPSDTAAQPVVAQSLLRVSMSLSRFSQGSRGLTRCHRLIEKTCLERYSMRRLDDMGQMYELRIDCPSRESLEDSIYALLDDMVQVAEANLCLLEVTVHEPATDSYWD